MPMPGGPGSSMGPPGGLTPGGTMPPGGMGGQNAAKGRASGGGAIAEVIDANKRRYLEVTPQVRRMPVAIVVVVDQAYMQDVLLAFANSPLQFQITQVTWKRFRDSLTSTGTSGPGGGPGSDIETGKGSNFISGEGDPDARPGGSSLGPPPRPGAPIGSGSGPPMPGIPPMPGGVGPGGPGAPGYGGSSSLIASESQITAGLVELSIYGIVSLYEKYSDAPASGEKEKAGEKPPAPAPMTPMPPTPPAPMPPMPPAPGPSPPGTKMRRRVRT
jgi:hypothetical protein